MSQLGSNSEDSYLDERKSSILRAVVAAYIEKGEPVGSSDIARMIAANGGSQVSPATVRNEMSFLEQAGYLLQPHASAGRIPTDRGYRYFVDQLGPSANLSQTSTLREPELYRVREVFDRAHNRIEELLGDTSRLLATLTKSAAVVINDASDVAAVRSAQIVRLSQYHWLALVVLSNGSIEKANIELEIDVSDFESARAAEKFARELVGKNLSTDVERDVNPSSLAPDEQLCNMALKALGRTHDKAAEVFVGGAAQISSAFPTI